MVHLKLARFICATIVACLVISCSTSPSSESRSTELQDKHVENLSSQTQAAVDLTEYLAKFGLHDVSELDPTIWYDMKYFGDDNFMHQQLYQCINRPFLQKDVAVRLVQCSSLLRSMDTSLHLLIYDAVRPVEVQKKMWGALDSIPPKERVKFVSNPKNKSLHNYGAAIDLTICRSDRTPLDMGAGFDDIRLIAYPSYEAHFLSTGELTKEQWNNRQLLRKVMRSQKFRNLPTEWWHFNACPRWEARTKYLLLDKEPPTQ